jgi:hypothetical protein
VTSLAESDWARRARHFCALEQRLFELLGSWVPSVPEPEVKMLLRIHSFQHAWHAELWADLLPVGEDPQEAAGGLRPGVAVVLDVLTQSTDTVDRLVAAYRGLLPSLVMTYGRARDGLEEASDGPHRRVLERIVFDDAEACGAAEGLLTRLFDVPSDRALPARKFDGVGYAVRAAGGLDYTDMA